MAPLRAFLASLLLLLVALPASAATPRFPALTGRVVDQANLLTPSQRVDLDSKLAALESRSGRQLVVATVGSLEGLPVQDYGYQLGRAWKIGDEKRDDGVILLVAPNERKVGIETGYGARVFVTDAMSSVIINEVILPRFKAGDMGGGIIAGADRIIELMNLSPQEAAKRNAAVADEVRRRSSGVDIGQVLVPGFFILFFFVLPLLRAAARGRRYASRRGKGGIDPWVVLWGLNEISRASRHRGGGGWSSGGSSWGGGGGFGGGGFSGGGGSFGGGGASGSW